MEYHLKEELIKGGFKSLADQIKPEGFETHCETDLALNEISITNPFLLINKDLMESNEMNNGNILNNDDISGIHL